MTQVLRKMQDTSLDSFTQLAEDGTLAETYQKALDLVEANEDLTVRELLQIGVREGVYMTADRNAIAPRLTNLAELGIIIRPNKRKCSITGKRVMTHCLAPESWRGHMSRLRMDYPDRKTYVVHRLELESATEPGLFHTCIMWTDDSITCTCNHHYHRPAEYRCHHALGMIRAVTGAEPGQEKEKGAAE